MADTRELLYSNHAPELWGTRLSELREKTTRVLQATLLEERLNGKRAPAILVASINMWVFHLDKMVPGERLKQRCPCCVDFHAPGCSNLLSSLTHARPSLGIPYPSGVGIWVGNLCSDKYSACISICPGISNPP